MNCVVRVELPQHLRTLAGVKGHEVLVEMDAPVTLTRVLDAVEERYPMLCGTIRDHGTKERRAFLRFFACERDLSHDPVDGLLPESVVKGTEPLIVLGAIAGGVGRTGGGFAAHTDEVEEGSKIERTIDFKFA